MSDEAATTGPSQSLVQFKTNRASYEALEAEAHKRGFKSVGLFVRSIVSPMLDAPIIDLPHKGARSTEKLSADRLMAIRELSRLGGNLNQLVRHLNSGGRISDATQVQNLIGKLSETIDQIRRGA